jgi:hypothetical protein
VSVPRYVGQRRTRCALVVVCCAAHIALSYIPSFRMQLCGRSRRDAACSTCSSLGVRDASLESRKGMQLRSGTRAKRGQRLRESRIRKTYQNSNMTAANRASDAATYWLVL